MDEPKPNLGSINGEDLFSDAIPRAKNVLGSPDQVSDEPTIKPDAPVQSNDGFFVNMDDLEVVSPQEIDNLNAVLKDTAKKIARGSEYEKGSIFEISLGELEDNFPKKGSINYTVEAKKSDDGKSFVDTKKIVYALFSKDYFKNKSFSIIDDNGTITANFVSADTSRPDISVDDFKIIYELLDEFNVAVNGTEAVVRRLLEKIIVGFTAGLSEEDFSGLEEFAKSNCDEWVEKEVLFVNFETTAGDDGHISDVHLAVMQKDSSGNVVVKEQVEKGTSIRIFKAMSYDIADQPITPRGSILAYSYSGISHRSTVNFGEPKIPAEPGKDTPERVYAQDTAGNGLGFSMWMPPEDMARYIADEKEKRAGVQDVTKSKFAKIKEILRSNHIASL